MLLESIRIQNVRRIAAAEFQPDSGINVISGPNGSGKTSLLEAIHLLGTTRSFRTHRAEDVISHGAKYLLVSGSVRTADTMSRHRLGIEKGRSATRIRIDGAAAKSASSLATLLPMLVVNAEAFALLDGSPVSRRALLDRTLFHVERDYLDKFKRFHRALKQRNELLRRRSPAAGTQFWNHELGAHAEAIDSARAACIAGLNAWLETLPINELLGAVNLDYRRGWKADASLADLLERNWERDRAIGSTSIGVHRAEIRVLVNGRSAAHSVSRGQGKLLIAALMTAHASYIDERSGAPPALLVDDVAAELDNTLRHTAVRMLLGTKAQIFFTAIEVDALSAALADRTSAAFHVEQGVVKQLFPQLA